MALIVSEYVCLCVRESVCECVTAELERNGNCSSSVQKRRLTKCCFSARTDYYEQLLLLTSHLHE